MIALTAILALLLSPDWSLNDEDQDFYVYRPVVEIEQEPTLTDVEIDLNYRDAIQRLEKLYPHIGRDE